jgi:uncharacterized protein (DUF885 family)
MLPCRDPYLEECFQFRPLEATQLGDHRFDDRLDDLSAAARQRWRGHYRRTLDELPGTVDYEQLSAAGKIDFEILQHELTRALWLAGARKVRPEARTGA